MMTPDAAKSLLSALSLESAKAGKQLNYMIDGGLAFCPVCGTAGMKDFSFKFAAVDGRDLDGREGLLLVFYLTHPAANKFCIFGLAGAPEQGEIAARMLDIGGALQVMNLEALMKGSLPPKMS